MKIFLTGGTGFIGSWMVKAILENTEHQLVLSARNSHKVPSYHQNPRIEMLRAGLSDREHMKAGLQGCDAVIHIALGWGDTPVEMLQNDTEPSVFLMESAIQAGVQQFITTSSIAAMGQMRPSMNEETRNIPLDLYGATKAATESYLLALSATTPMKLNIVRPGYTFGNPAFEDSFTQPDRTFHQFAEHAVENQDIFLTKNDGTQFIHAGELAKIYLGILDSGCTGEIFLGLSPEFNRWSDIAEEGIRLNNSSAKVVFEDKGYGETPMRFDVSKIKDWFGIEASPKEEITKHLGYLSGLFPGTAKF
ncbi:MAG: NAD(P)-dependent oxidoreductase [bacterium]|nr:NAD(P)-dependent oxidoreductase [bacterium]